MQIVRANQILPLPSDPSLQRIFSWISWKRGKRFFSNWFSFKKD